MRTEDILKIIGPIIIEINVEKKKNSKKGGEGNIFSGFIGGGGKPVADPDLTKEEYVIQKTVCQCIQEFTKETNHSIDDKENLFNAQYSFDSISVQ